MADGGASTMIILVASLLISGAASVVLIDAWGDVVKTASDNSKGKQADAETDISFSGDIGDVELDTSGANQNITLYFLNTGVRNLDNDSLSIFVDGVPSNIARLAIYPTSTVWGPDYLVEVIVSEASFAYVDNDIVKVTAVVKSTVSGGASGTASVSEEVRLSV